MNGLSGKCVNVVLAVEMGRGMDFLESPVKIVATFNGRPLESDLSEPNQCPLFNTELVWETEKKELRKIRSINTPIKVEVQLVDKNQRKDRIGFALLSPRCANIIPADSKLEIPFKWHKLLGVSPDNKMYHPELYLSLTIRDVVTAAPIQPYLAEISIDDTEIVTDKPFEKDGQTISIRYLPDGFVQIGGDECRETFLFSITIQVAYNLDLLLPEVLVFNHCSDNYYISFTMFGITIKSKPFCRDLHANFPMNEKIVVRIRSQYEILRTYFAEHCKIMVFFYCGQDQLGTTNLEVDMLLKTITAEQFSPDAISNYGQKCFFKFPSLHGIVPTGPKDRQPFMEVTTTLKRTDIRPPSAVSSSTSIETDTIPNVKSIPRFSDIKENMDEEVEEDVIPEPHLVQSCESINDFEQETFEEAELPKGNAVGCGDNAKATDTQFEKSVSPAVSAYGDRSDVGQVFEQALELNELDSEKVNVMPPVSNPVTDGIECLLEDPPRLQSPEPTIKQEDIKTSIVKYQKYCLDIMLESLNLKKSAKSNKLFLKFKHPKSSTTAIVSEVSNDDTTAGEDIMLENSRCKMFFVSTTEHIRKMVYAWPPKLIITDENGVNLTEELDIYTAMFLSKQRTECSYITECKSVRTYEPFAKISISMYLQEYGLQALHLCTNFDLLPPILDEELAISELQQLQEWKEYQHTQFLADLKIVEKQRMAVLYKDWAKRKKGLEDKLTKTVIRCQTLSQELQVTVNNMRTRRALEFKESQLNKLPNCSFGENIQRNSLKYEDFETNQLIETISKLERDNDHLNGIINDQRLEMAQINKTALTKEQTTNLLQQLRGLEEKFELAQKSKAYFKEQWKKAVREIHDLKSEEQKQMQEKIQHQRIELSQYSLDNFVANDGCYKTDDYQSPPFNPYKWDNLDAPLEMLKPRPSYNTNNI